MKDFMQMGITSTNNLAIDGGNDKGNFRVSSYDMLHKGTIPDSDRYRNGLATSVSYKSLDKLTFSSNVNYTHSRSNSRPSTGDRRANPLEAVYASPYVNYEEMKD